MSGGYCNFHPGDTKVELICPFNLLVAANVRESHEKYLQNQPDSFRESIIINLSPKSSWSFWSYIKGGDSFKDGQYCSSLEG
jgi:hypothetical protein